MVKMNKEESNNITSSEGSEASFGECCMCGDFGVSSELFHCQLCRFRSQHRYCSNLYPEAESYQVCNWCLASTDETKEKSQNSSNSSSSIKTKRNLSQSDNGGDTHHQSSLVKKKPIINKLQRSSSERPPTTVKRKRIITNRELEEKLRRTKSDHLDNPNRVITKPVFRNKVRRYKLLEEVSS